MKVLVVTTSLLLYLYFLADAQSTASFMSPTDIDSNYSKVTCDFRHSSCGWENVAGYRLTWEKKNGYMSLPLRISWYSDGEGRLASPWLHPLEDYVCEMRFRYYLHTFFSDNSGLRLIRQTASGREESLLAITESTGLRSFSNLLTQKVNCTGENYRLLFEGWRTNGWWLHEIDVTTVTFIYHHMNMTPATEPTPPEGMVFTIAASNYTGLYNVSGVAPPFSSSLQNVASHSTPVSTSPQQTFPERDKTSGTEAADTKGDRGTPSALGSQDSSEDTLIIIVVVVIVTVVIVVIVAVVVVRKRRRNNGAKESGRKSECAPATVNPAYLLDTQQTAGNNEATRTDSTAEEGNYCLAHVPRPSPTANHTHTQPRADGNHVSASSSTDDYHHLHLSSSSHPRPPSSHAITTTASQDTYDRTRGAALPAPAISSTINTANTNNIVDDGDYNQLHLKSRPAPSPATIFQDDTYDHTSGPLPKATAATTATTATNSNDKKLHPKTKTVSPSSEGADDDTYDHSSRAQQQPSPATHNINDDYNQLHLRSKPGSSPAKTAADHTYDHTNLGQPQPQQPVSDIYAQPHKKHHQQAIPDSSQSAAEIWATAGTTNYESVDDVSGVVRSPAVVDVVYNRLDAAGERGDEKRMGENLYDHTQGDTEDGNYHSLHLETRRRQMQRQLAEGDYSHVETSCRVPPHCAKN